MSNDEVVRKRAEELVRQHGLNIYVAIALALQPADTPFNLLPCPPNLERGMGYVGAATYVAFYWQTQQDEARFDDGQVRGTADVRMYQLFTHHPFITPFLRDVNLGNSTNDAAHALVLNRQTRQLVCRPLSETMILLQDQWLWQSGSSSVSDAAIHAMLQRLRTKHDGMAQEEQWAIYEAIQQWLDGRLSPP